MVVDEVYRGELEMRLPIVREVRDFLGAGLDIFEIKTVQFLMFGIMTKGGMSK